MIDSKRVTIADSPTEAVPASEHAESFTYSVLITNLDRANTVDLGGPSVVFGAGYPLQGGDSVPVQLKGGEKLFAVADDGLSVELAVLFQGL